MSRYNLFPINNGVNRFLGGSMDDYAMMVSLSTHKLLSLAIQEFWRNELDQDNEVAKTIAEKFHLLVMTGTAADFKTYITGDATIFSHAIPFVIDLLDDEENTDGRYVEDIPDSMWESIQHQLKSDLVGWL